MNTKNKFLLLVVAMLLSLTVAVIINIGLNFRDFAIQSAVKKAELAAEIIKDGLTTQMVDGVMSKRQYFLDTIMQNKNIKNLWIVRGKNVNKQFGPGFTDEAPRDSIDRHVLATGKMVEKFTENADNAKLRITIPYKAISNSTTTCIKCHHVAYGATLGAVSMEMNIDGTRNAGAVTLVKIFGINIAFLILVLLILNYYMKPYMKFFDDLRQGIKKAHYGDFTSKIHTNVKGEAQEVANQINTLFKKMQEAFGEIKHTLATFVTKSNVSCNDPLYEAKMIISELSDIYKFKKTIELDKTRDEIYSRFILIMQTKFNIQNFCLFEADKINGTRKMVYTSSISICDATVDSNVDLCRAYRTNSDITSTDFPDLCESCTSQNKEYICMPYNINEDVALVIEMIFEDEKTLNEANEHLSSIKNYLEAAKPVIESKILTDKLRDTSLRDGMTKLYNRRFLEEFIETFSRQAKRDSSIAYSVLMLDIDFFKMVNDTYGHNIGDLVIKTLADIMQDSIRQSDMAIRYGGEEFLILLYNTTKEGALKVAQTINLKFAKAIFDAKTETFQKTISIGVAHFPDDGDSLWKVIKMADIALYYAKEHGRDQVVEFKSQMHEGEDF